MPDRGELTPLHDVVAPRLAELPSELKKQLTEEFWRRLDGDPFPDAGSPPPDWPEKRRIMDHLTGAVDELLAEHIHIAFDYDEIDAASRKYAQICQMLARLKNYPAYRVRYANENGDHKIWHAKMKRIEQFCAAKSIEPPAVTKYGNERGRIRRACTVKFWRRRLIVHYGRRAEHATRKAGLVQRRRSIYVSGLAYRAHRQKVAATDRWVKKCAVVSDAGDHLSLASVIEKSQANPALRRAELMTRLRGFEEIAEELNHVGEFVTLTVPSEFHAMNAIGTPNQNYAGHTVREAQAWLQKMWARSRAQFKRKGITVYGFRIAEPHHDGTPHWHMVLFTMAHHRKPLRRVLAGHWLSEGGRDAGAKDHRIKFKAIDRTQGSAAGYLAKYIAKNIDGFEVGDDNETDERSEPASADETNSRESVVTSRRVVAWAALHGIRQFQQIGGPPVGLWRELRRIRKKVDHDIIERARLQAEEKSWAGMVREVGGIAAGRNVAVRVWKENLGTLSWYGELQGDVPAGVMCGAFSVRSRFNVWRIMWERKDENDSEEPQSNSRSVIPSYLGPVSITVLDAPLAGDPVLWSNPNETSMYGPN